MIFFGGCKSTDEKIYADVIKRLDYAEFIVHGKSIVNATLIVARKLIKNKIDITNVKAYQTVPQS